MKMYIIQFTYVQVSASLIASFFEKKSEHFRTMFPGEPCKSVIHADTMFVSVCEIVLLIPQTIAPQQIIFTGKLCTISIINLVSLM